MKINERITTLLPQELILSLFGEYVDAGEKAWSGGLVHILEDLGFLAPTARIALNRVVGRHLLTPIKFGRLVYYSITPRLELIHKEARQLTFSAVADPEWTGIWTLVWYTVPADKRLGRSRLGRWLNLSGFGSLQDGTWIAPGNSRSEINSLCERLGLEDHVVIFVGDVGDEADPLILINNAWNLPELARMIDYFVAEMAPYYDDTVVAKLSPKEAFILRTRVIDMFRKIEVQDPHIPDHILKINWKRREAIKIFNYLQNALLEKARDYFRQEVLTADVVSETVLLAK